MKPNKIYVPEFEASATFEAWRKRSEQLLKEMKEAEQKYLAERLEKKKKINAIYNAVDNARIDAI